MYPPRDQLRYVVNDDDAAVSGRQLAPPGMNPVDGRGKGPAVAIPRRGPGEPAHIGCPGRAVEDPPRREQIATEAGRFLREGVLKNRVVEDLAERA
jgi:hypothetical protein